VAVHSSSREALVHEICGLRTRVLNLYIKNNASSERAGKTRIFDGFVPKNSQIWVKCRLGALRRDQTIW